MTVIVIIVAGFAGSMYYSKQRERMKRNKEILDR
jgi:preprotein translocase subunit YajC